MKPRSIFVPLLMVAITTSRHKGFNNGPRVNENFGPSISLIPHSATFDMKKVPQGAVGFTALTKNEGTSTILIAHPSVCFPADYKPGKRRRVEDSHGKSELLLMITKPDGNNVTLREGFLHYFDPGNVPTLRIPPKGIETFEVGWFFQNARGRWEQDDVAAKVFLSRGRYRIRIRLRNIFPEAELYNEETNESGFADVWTGDMESEEITIEIK